MPNHRQLGIGPDQQHQSGRDPYHLQPHDSALRQEFNLESFNALVDELAAEARGVRLEALAIKALSK